MGTQMTWEDELKTLLSGDWRPRLAGGFSVMGRLGCAVVELFPPQGVYAQWTGKLWMSGAERPAVVHGETAAVTLAVLRKGHDKVMEALGGFATQEEGK